MKSQAPIYLLRLNIPLSMNLLGNPLEKHHIFPKRLLYENGRSRREVNSLGNFAFITRETNRSIGYRLPLDYLAECEAMNPGVLESQWIPNDPKLWELKKYQEFLAARRERLTNAANTLLISLRKGELPLAGIFTPLSHEHEISRPIYIDSDEEEHQLRKCQQWLSEQGLPEGELGYELVDKETGELYAILDLAWPDGVQAGLTHPVALLINEDSEIHDIIQQRGFRYFTNPADFKRYVEREILAQ